MKKIVIVLISLLIANYRLFSGSLVSESDLNSSDTIRLFSTPGLQTISNEWATEYTKLFPEVKIKVKSIQNTEMAESSLENGGIGFVSNGDFRSISGEAAWKIVVGRDVIVPVINANNPFLEEIKDKGVSPQELSFLLESANKGNWGTLLNGNQNGPVHFYITDDESVLNGLSEFLKTDITKSKGIKIENTREMISSLQKDPYAIGFCKMINVVDSSNQKLTENLSLLTIDRNGDGTIDYNEKIYDDFNVFSRAVWIGKYPKTLYSNIYSVSSKQPVNTSELAFLKWILNDGQKFLGTRGYSDLLLTERQATSDRLYEANAYQVASISNKSEIITFLIIIVVIISAGFAVDFAVRSSRRKRSTGVSSVSEMMPVLNENSLVVPGGIYFDKTHTWAFMEQTGIVKVGIDDFMQHITGTITRLKMKNEGEKVKKGDQILSIIQNGKQLNIYAPVSGVIKERNTVLDSDAALVNRSPYNEGWIYRIEPTNWLRENQLLFMADKQRQFLKSEFSRLKDFLSETLKTGDEKYALLVLQDGGELSDNTLSNLGPEVWDDFQTKFIDPSRQIWFYELF
jgi:glycine cleavage system H lipoate-binding protein/ABC-type phosphate transport system substrate-binding protein